MVLDTVFIPLVMDMVILDTLLLAMAMDTVLAMPIMDMESVMLMLSQRLMLSMEPMVDMVMDLDIRACHKSKFFMIFFGTGMFGWVCMYINGKFWFWQFFFIFRWVKMPPKGYDEKI